MRISTSQIFSNGVNRMLEQQAQLIETQTQLASGKRIINPSDDPVGAVRSLELTRANEKTAQYDRNANYLDARLRVEENAISNSIDVLQRVKQLAVQANNAAQSNESRAAIAAELDQHFSALLDLANTRDSNGRSIFAGYQQSGDAFTKTATGVVYNGDDGQRALQVGANRTLADSDPGSHVFMGINNGNSRFQTSANPANTGDAYIDAGSVTDLSNYSGESFTIAFTAADQYQLLDSAGSIVGGGNFANGDSITVGGMTVTLQGQPQGGDEFQLQPAVAQDVFSMVAELRDSLIESRPDAAARGQQTTEINTSLANLDRALDHLITTQAGIGARMQTLERQIDINSAASLQIQENLSLVNDLDYAEAISRFEQQRIGLEAAQKAFAKVQGLSLFNYI
ncbi:flagellar hook-associated protein FlgL [Spongiibacter sp. KMU-166]|uniref:Flagellar hook-associated protein FlgL n=1 Tax=Spongiibacter thalassae TaxID=2721624 RepID=A0ABX1GE37_9GAMM|nr:flagellar hook-associated protein FlgL [Spongiibacter thalassae]NKI16762.1 flagellar hook-associated protein FlgL [Spongiibacter thalassae]